MKHLSLRAKITLWFTAALLLVVFFTYVMVIGVGNRILQKTVRDNLIETVENNSNDIRFYETLDDLDPEGDYGRFVKIGSGFLEIHDNFLDKANEVYTSLYDSGFSLLYGENPIPAAAAEVKFRDSQIQTVDADGETFYIFDRRLSSKGMGGIWMRGIVSENQGSAQTDTITRATLLVLPLIASISCIGGYFLVRRMLRPIQKISDTARQIGSENDLKKRIELGGGKDELHRLADTFNDMFEKLERSFEAERRFVSDASHELRTPMSVILAQCELSLDRKRDPEEDENAFQVIQRQGDKMSALIADLLDFTRLEAGTDKYPMEEVELSELVSSVCGDMALLGEKGISLDRQTEDGIRIYGNRELLSRLLTNLISNAYRYGREGGHIHVALRESGGQVILSVEDDGIGIAEDEKEKIFGRFYQVEGSRSGRGMGLGLSMAEEIAKFHGGTIKVESKLGVGSTFSVVFDDARSGREKK